MTFKSRPLAKDVQERKLFHSIFKEWLHVANEEDFTRFERARELFAPNRVCSAISLVRGCLERTELENMLPPTLRQLLRERCWQQGGDALKAP